jgi:hypothetical protein
MAYNMTMKYAKQVIGDNYKDVKVVFSNHINGENGRCYPFLRTIVYCDGYMKLNRNNSTVIKYTVIEECAHLIRLSHDEIFYKLCCELGYDISVPPPGIKYYWRYLQHCDKCGNEKYYYQKPRNKICKECGNESTVFFGDVAG